MTPEDDILPLTESQEWAAIRDDDLDLDLDEWEEIFPASDPLPPPEIDSPSPDWWDEIGKPLSGNAESKRTERIRRQSGITTPSRTSQCISQGNVVRWGNRLSDWIVESVEGAIARVRQQSGYASNLTWSAPIDELQLISEGEAIA